MIRRPPRSTQGVSSAASDVYKRQEMNETYNLSMPALDDYETIGGLVLHHAEEIPEAGFTLRFEHCLITVEQVGRSKVQTVIVNQIPDTAL